jgi:predicted PurR-regulated permease PerM
LRVRNAARLPEGAIDRFRIDGALSQKRRQTRPPEMIEDASTAAAARRLSAETVATRRTPSSSEVFIIGVIVVAVLYLARDVFIPLALATLLAFALAPTVLMLRRWHFNRILSVVCVVVLAFIVIIGIGTVMGGQLAQLAENLPGYQTNIINKIRVVRGTGNGNGTIERTTAMIQKLGDEIAKSDTSGSQTLKPGGPPTQAPIPVQIRQPDPTPFAIVETTVGPLLQPLATTGIVIIFVIFVLLQREDLRDRFIRLAGRGDLHRTTDALDEAAKRISRYLLAQAAINTCFGLLIGTGLWLIGAPNPVLCGITAMLLRFVPYVGPIIAATLPAALTLAVDPGWSMLFWAMGLFLTAELIIGQIVEPWLYGHNTGLSTIAIVVAAAFWTWLWGPVGLLLSTPLTVCLVVLGRHVEHLQFLDVLLGDQPALAPEEGFYQRMLADDPDEAAHQAEEMLKTVPLATYYDEVAVKGLALAQIDVNRGALDHECRARIKGAVDGLIDDLSDHADPEAPPTKETAAKETGETDAAAAPVFAPDELPAGWRKTPVMCVAGRGSLDEAAAAMLAQLLGARGIAASVVATGVVSAGNLFRLDGDGVQVACLSYLEPGGYTSARFLVRRLRRKLPRATILVCFWSLSEGEAEAARQATGADRVVTSLREAVSQVVEAATAAGGGGAPAAPASETAEQPAAG